MDVLVDVHAHVLPLPELDLRALELGRSVSGAHEGRGSTGASPLQRAHRVPPRVEGTPADPAHVWRVLDTVLDPEVPAVSLVELGIVRDVICTGTAVEVVLTPTYSGCPATEMIESAVRGALAAAGYRELVVSQRRAPAWTTDWITEAGRRRLLDYGIAPPTGHATHQGNERPVRLIGRGALAPVACPRCASVNTERLSAFGSTACKSLHRCRDCHEPFEYFKPI